MILPEAYIVQKFYQYAGKPKYNTLAKTYQGSCPICREGKSWGRKQRLFYIVTDNYLHCHNCGGHWSPLNWIKEVSGLSAKEIYNESEEYDVIPSDISNKPQIQDTIQRILTGSLPDDCINLFNSTQTSYYQSNPVVQTCLSYIKNRKLDVAINKPKALYVTLKDFTHKNRLIIPFYDSSGKIIFYQSRDLGITPNSLPKYIGKVGGHRSVFNINQIDENINQIYILEGPIDAFFIKNGVALAGINDHTAGNLFTSLQQQQFQKFPLHKKVFVLDSQWLDKTSYRTSKVLLNNGCNIFIWPKKFGKKFKDLNEMCVRLNINKVPETFINENTYKGLPGIIKLTQISH